MTTDLMGSPEKANMEQHLLTGGSNDTGDAGTAILRRNNRGCKATDFYNWPDQALDDMDSPLAVQQYIQQLIRKDPSNVNEILKLPEGQDLGAWKIEHLRMFCMQLNRLATHLQDCCQPDTCNQMTATEQWIFLCAAHKTPNECPAIDYTRHTLDGAASLLNSNKYFPSRVTIKESSVAKLSSVCRRVYRIFSHAYYHHFSVFDEFERETHLCKRFSKFVSMYDLMSKDSLIVPSDSLGIEQDTAAEPTDDFKLTSISNGPEPTADAVKETTQESTSSSTTTNPITTSTKPADTTSNTSAANETLIQTNRASEPFSSSTNTMVKGSSISQELANANKSNPATTTATSTTIPNTETTAILSVEPDQQQQQHNNPTNTLARKPTQIKSGVKSEA